MIDNEKILEKVKLKISSSKFDEKENIEIKRKNIMSYKYASVACLVIILTTSVVFSKDIEKVFKYYFGDNKLVNYAAENGYVENVVMDVVDTEKTVIRNNDGKEIEDVNASVKIDEFLMDDVNLSMNFTFEFDDKVKEVFDIDNVQILKLQDLMIFDDENRIIYTNCNENNFEKVCKEYALDYSFEEFYLNYNPSIYNQLINYDKENNAIKYNLNLRAQKNYFPSSKKLNIVFSKIILERYINNGEDVNNGELLENKSVIFTDNWYITVDVPEKMYNRKNVKYKAVSISHPDFEFVSAIASETGLKFNVIVSNVNASYEENYYDNLVEKYMSGQITEEEFKNKTGDNVNVAVNNYMKNREIIRTDYADYLDDKEKIINNITHVENSKGKKVKIEDSSLAIIDFKKDKDKYEFYGTFEITKYDATDKMKVVIIYYGEPVYIELERVEQN